MMPGKGLLNEQYTASSLVGMIVLAARSIGGVPFAMLTRAAGKVRDSSALAFGLSQ